MHGFRRQLTRITTAAGLLCLISAGSAQAVTSEDIHNRFKSLGTWVDWANTPFDGFKYNAQNRFQNVTVVGVVWHPSLKVIQVARDRGCDLLIFHEPLFYDDSTPGVQSDPGYAQKKQILDDTGIVMYRSHDFQDRFPDLGVHDQWKSFLGLTGDVVEDYNSYISVSEEPPKTVGQWAKQIARKSAELGQPRIRLVGDPAKVVRRIAYGTGAVAWPRANWQVVSADLVVTTEVHWIDDARWAIEMGYPLIAVDHGVSEIPGIRRLKDWMEDQWPALEWHFIENDLEYRIIK